MTDRLTTAGMPKTAKQSRQNKNNLHVMKTFDELFKEAAEISDRRKKVFNQLIERTETEIIPAFAEVLRNYDLNKAFFTMYISPISGMDAGRDEEGDEIWSIGIENDGRIWKCVKDPYSRKYEPYEQMRTRVDERNTDLPVAEFRRSSIISLVKKINNRIDELNKKYSANIEEAEALLNDKNK